MSKVWSLSKVWNESIGKRADRKVEPRDYIYASELGKSDVDIWLRMKGTEPTNLPNDRSYRKFDAGDLFEWFVRMILVKCGIYLDSQTPVKTQMDECVAVSGRLDYIAGGKPDYSKASVEIDNIVKLLGLPDLFKKISDNMIEYFKANYPDGLDEKVLEVKSVALFGFEKVEKTNKPLKGHDLQLFHYAHNLNKEGALCYICRDDLRMYEIPILPNDQKILKAYKDKIKRVSDFYFENQQPEPESVILFDEDLERFSKNFNVEYSSYLTKLYNIERPDEYDEMFSPMIERWNRVLGRIKEGKEMTANNEEALNEMSSRGFDVELIKSKLTIKKNDK